MGFEEDIRQHNQRKQQQTAERVAGAPTSPYQPYIATIKDALSRPQNNSPESETIELDAGALETSNEMDMKKAMSVINDTLEKGGKKAVVGEVRMFGGREYIKTPDGWKFHGKGTGKKAQEHKASVGGGESKESKETAIRKEMSVAQDKVLKKQELTEREKVLSKFHGTTGMSEGSKQALKYFTEEAGKIADDKKDKASAIAKKQVSLQDPVQESIDNAEQQIKEGKTTREKILQEIAEAEKTPIGGKESNDRRVAIFEGLKKHFTKKEKADFKQDKAGNTDKDIEVGNLAARIIKNERSLDKEEVETMRKLMNEGKTDMVKKFLDSHEKGQADKLKEAGKTVTDTVKKFAITKENISLIKEAIKDAEPIPPHMRNAVNKDSVQMRVNRGKKKLKELLGTDSIMRAQNLVRKYENE